MSRRSHEPTVAVRPRREPRRERVVPSGARVLLLATVAALTIAACGPSLRQTQRASAYFERCYAADIDALVPDGERRACWQAWKHDYQTGATPERLDYVRERLAMLDPDRAAVIELATGNDASPEPLDLTPATVVTAGSVDTGAREAPTPPTPSEAAPPDSTIAQGVRADVHARARERHLHRGIIAPSTLTRRCPCEAEWAACSTACLADDRGCILACRREHVLCSRSCY